MQNDATFVDSLHQTLDHDGFGFEFIATMHEMDFGGDVREVKRFFQSGIATAHHGDGLFAIKETVTGCTCRDSATFIRGFRFKTQILSRGTRGDDQCIARERFTHVGHKTNRGLVEMDLSDHIEFDLGAETFGMIKESLHEFGSLDTVDISRPVFDFSGGHQLTALFHSGDQ